MGMNSAQNFYRSLIIGMGDELTFYGSLIGQTIKVFNTT